MPGPTALTLAIHGGFLPQALRMLDCRLALAAGAAAPQGGSAGKPSSTDVELSDFTPITVPSGHILTGFQDP